MQANNDLAFPVPNWNALSPIAQRAQDNYKRRQDITKVAIAHLAVAVSVAAVGVICFTAVPLAVVAAVTGVALIALAVSYWKFVMNCPHNPSAVIQRAREEKNLLRQTYDHGIVSCEEPAIRKEVENLDAQILVYRPLQKRAWIEQLEKEIAEKKKILEQDSLLKRHRETYEELEDRDDPLSKDNRAAALRFIDRRLRELDEIEKKEIDPHRERLKLLRESYAATEVKVTHNNALHRQLQSLLAERDAARADETPLNLLRIQMLQATSVDALGNLFQRALQDVDARLEDNLRRI